MAHVGTRVDATQLVNLFLLLLFKKLGHQNPSAPIWCLPRRIRWNVTDVIKIEDSSNIFAGTAVDSVHTNWTS
jgi:hypothetical protein